MTRERTIHYINRVTVSRGFTLVELMVAMLIGLIITIGVVQIFGSNRATYQLDESLARAQENGRFALEFLSQDIRHAGNLGCKRDAPHPGEQAGTRNPFSYLVPSGTYNIYGITGLEYSGTGIGATYSAAPYPANTTSGWAAPTGGAPAFTTLVPNPGALPGSDVIAIQRMAPNPWPLVPPYVSRTQVFVDPAYATQINVRDILMLTSCVESPALFQVTSIDSAGVIDHVTGGGSPGNACGNWGENQAGAVAAAGIGAAVQCTMKFARNLGPDLALGKLQTTVFYVANDATNQNRPTLYRNVPDMTGTPYTQPLVEGVESLQVLYGVDDVNIDGIADRYVTADNLDLASLPYVVSARISLLVHGTNASGTANDVALDTDTYNLAGTIFDPQNDRLKRRVFGTTIQLRNRGL
jgi:type IV pilus assembly protein PilW